MKQHIIKMILSLLFSYFFMIMLMMISAIFIQAQVFSIESSETLVLICIILSVSISVFIFSKSLGNYIFVAELIFVFTLFIFGTIYNQNTLSHALIIKYLICVISGFIVGSTNKLFHTTASTSSKNKYRKKKTSRT